ncbi:SRPBCC family protein [Bacillaceae bacterium Marseille-Q3522]|nr:SRPBCC family protein [Bacillaceae bacterium Marseille-Q3522]
MASHFHKTEASASVQDVWQFVSNINNWAPLVPGYIHHEVLNERETIWTFKSDLGTGILKKKIQLKVTITKWVEFEKITFDLSGINEKFSGDGFFEAEAKNSNITVITGCLRIQAEGIMAKVGNAILQANLPVWTEQLTSAVAEKISDQKAHT